MQRSVGIWVIALIGLGFVSLASPPIAQQSIDVDATLVFDRTEFELGEPIVFAYGRKVPGMIDVFRLLEPLCELSVRRPDGSKLFARESQGITVYDGPSQVNRLFRKALLNGNWLITHATEDELLPVETTRAQIRTLQKGGFTIDYREYAKTHTIDPKRELPEIRAWVERRVQ